MKLRPTLFFFGCLALATPSLSAQVIYSKPRLSHSSAGFIESKLFGEWYRGSGVVARDPRLIYSCAHVFYENGIWASDYLFYRAYHRKNYPAPREGVRPRGILHFSSYTSSVSSFGADSNQAFASDFTVLYGNSSFGTPVGWFANGAAALKSRAAKRIVGYPAEIDFTGAQGHCFQHSTATFNQAAYTVRGSFLEFNNVSTGPGNSGGPVFVHDSTSRKELLAGMLVSGSRRTAGAIALSSATHSLSSSALGLKSRQLSFDVAEKVEIPDGSRSFTVVKVPISGFSGNVESLRLALDVATPRRSDLEIYLQSPSGKIRWITRKSAGSTRDLEIQDLNLDSSFKGSDANGIWSLHLRDSVKGNDALLEHASLQVTAL
ncbi:MAG: proprotein convertase P-domain-containing protein [Akkermansiaceae bacterium]|nr:proprotein convertase P-domain-containing protein [Akkermansiaceae bacterium]